MTELALAHNERISAIANQVVARFSAAAIDGEQVALEWRKAFETPSIQVPDSKAVHHFDSERVYAAFVDYCVADLHEDHAITRVRIAEMNRAEARVRLESTLAEFDGYFINKDRGERIVPKQLAVLRPDRRAQNRRLISTSERIARETISEIAFDAADEAHTSEFKEYYSDLIELLDQGGARQRGTVIRIIKNRSFAQSLLQTRSTPPPLKFLAQCVIQATPEELSVDGDSSAGNYL